MLRKYIDFNKKTYRWEIIEAKDFLLFKVKTSKKTYNSIQEALNAFKK